MSITLKSFKPEVESFVQQELASGRYESLDDVIEQALALLEKQSHYDEWIVEMRSEVDGAIGQLDDLRSVVDHRGEGVDGDVVMAEMFDRLYGKSGNL
jgi:antitoxin ParD1/3/4